MYKVLKREGRAKRARLETVHGKGDFFRFFVSALVKNRKRYFHHDFPRGNRKLDFKHPNDWWFEIESSNETAFFT